MDHESNFTKSEPRISKTLRSDFHQTKIREEFKSEYKDLKRYFLNSERKEKLAGMNPFKKFFILPWWLLKALYFRLTAFRRLLLFIGLIFLLLSGNIETSNDNDRLTINVSAILSGIIFLFILALELKDKLTAKTELEEGKAIQQSLMPEQSPKVPGWDIWLFTRSANDVGGDLLDFIQIEENRFGIAVGDVAGKGLSAALLMAKLQSTIRALVYDAASLSFLGEKLNKIFHRDSPSKIFASLVFAEIRTEFTDLKLINAGHYPPVILRNNQIEQLQKCAPALGLVKDANFSEKHISLNKNDFVIIYSDGLTEAQNETGEFFGEPKLIDLLKNRQSFTSQQLGEMIIANVDFFVNKTPAHDDLTLAILKKI
ncbi:MAG: PP2C family protein-serine/threonine phosphatase [Ignavibacteriaceae bacterium]|nr:PP2C family protein-serine/threonine phosphatase [Ignavibacteriaceae bacterium]